MNKCWYGVIIFWHCLASSRSSWSLDFSCRHLRNYDINTLGSLTVPGSSISLSISLSIIELGLTTPNVNDGVCYLFSGNYVPRELEHSLNIDINVSSKTLILKIYHIYFLFLFKNIQHFLHQKLKSLKFSIRSNKHELIHERLLFFVDFLFTFSHMA
jgi:hypothetical protein